MVFIGEKPEIASYKPFFKDAEEEKKEEEKKDQEDGDKKKEEKKEEHWQDEKFLYKEHFGETLTSKQRPAIFVFNLEENKLKQVHFSKHLLDTDYPQYPVFDQESTGIIFTCLHLPIKKLGLNFCLNKPVSLEYIRNPKFTKEDAEKEENYLQCLNIGEYFSMQPRFS